MAVRILVIGIGNRLRHDDGAGPAVAQRLREWGTHEPILVMEGDGAALLESWEGAEAVVVIDAVRSGVRAGTLHRFEAHASPLPHLMSSTSSHAFGLVEAVELARALGRLPAQMIVYGIEGSDFTAGVGLTPEVATGVEAVATRVQDELDVLKVKRGESLDARPPQ